MTTLKLPQQDPQPVDPLEEYRRMQQQVLAIPPKDTRKAADLALEQRARAKRERQ